MATDTALDVGDDVFVQRGPDAWGPGRILAYNTAKSTGQTTNLLIRLDSGPIKWVLPKYVKHYIHPSHIKETNDDMNLTLTPTLAARKVEEARLALLAAEEELRLANERLRYPAEPPAGTAIRFDLQFREGEQRYTYTALNINGEWYLSGSRKHTPRNWRDLLDWMRKFYFHSDIRVLRDDYTAKPLVPESYREDR